MTLTQLISEVAIATNRPDLTNDITQAIRKATMKCHLADEFKFDLSEVVITVPTQTDFHYQLDLSNTTNYPLFRKVSHIQEYNLPLAGNEIVFEPKDAAGLMDDYMLESNDYYYQAGYAINIGSHKQLTQLRVGYWKLPDIGVSTYSSWIANMYPDAIIDEAASTVFKAIGKDAEFDRFKEYFIENLAFLRAVGL